jgi:hypothetical protein
MIGFDVDSPIVVKTDNIGVLFIAQNSSTYMMLFFQGKVLKRVQLEFNVSGHVRTSPTLLQKIITGYVRTTCGNRKVGQHIFHMMILMHSLTILQ